MDEEAKAALTMRVSPFESIKHGNEQGEEYWSARELSRILGYTRYDKFLNAIDKAKIACEESDHQVADHFIELEEPVKSGKNTITPRESYRLSRYACYLVVQNADPSKPGCLRADLLCRPDQTAGTGRGTGRVARRTPAAALSQ